MSIIFLNRNGETRIFWSMAALETHLNSLDTFNGIQFCKQWDQYRDNTLRTLDSKGLVTFIAEFEGKVLGYVNII
jgi:phage terminase small subunit